MHASAIYCRLTRLLSEKRGVASSPATTRDNQIKLKALNNAAIKMSAQIEELESKNARLTKKLKMVS